LDLGLKGEDSYLVDDLRSSVLLSRFSRVSLSAPRSLSLRPPLVEYRPPS